MQVFGVEVPLLAPRNTGAMESGLEARGAQFEVDKVTKTTSKRAAHLQVVQTVLRRLTDEIVSVCPETNQLYAAAIHEWNLHYSVVRSLDQTGLD